MSIEYSQLLAEDEWRFKSDHKLWVPLPNNKYLVTLSGVVIVDFQGESEEEWRRERLNLGLRFPTRFLPEGKWFQIEGWVPFVTINAVYNRNVANHAGWAVDAFGSSYNQAIYNSVLVWADIAVRDTDGWLYRVGYTLTMSGTPVDAPPGPD